MTVTSTGNAKSVQPVRAKIRSTDGLSTADLSTVPVSYDVVLEELARKSLTPKENTNKNTFYAVVVKMLSDTDVKERRIMSDLFLNEDYSIDREENTSNAENSDSRIALLHIPALYSYFTADTRYEASTKDLTTSDLFLIPAKTGLSLVKGSIVKVTFGDMDNFSDITIMKTNKKGQIIKSPKAKQDNKKAFNDLQNQCLKLQSTPATGSAITANSLVNPTNPTAGYAQFYVEMISNVINSDKLLKKLIFSLGSTNARTQLTELGGAPNANEIQSYFLNEADYIPLKVKIDVGDAKIKDYINSFSPVNNNNNNSQFPIGIATKEIKSFFPTTDPVEDPRSIYFTFDFINPAARAPNSNIKLPNQIKETINTTLKNYIKGVVQNTYKYGFYESSQNENIFRIDIFGKSNDLSERTVEAAIEYSKQKKARNTPGLLDLATNTRYSSQTTAQQSTTNTPTSISANQELDACTRANRLVNNSAYIAMIENKMTPDQKNSFNKDRNLVKQLYKGANGILSDKDFLYTAVTRDLDEAKTSLEQSSFSDFTYNSSIEIISLQDETSKKEKKIQSTGGKATGKIIPGTRGTNIERLEKNNENLLKFCNAFKKFIAANEGLPEKNVLLLPLSTFRKYRKVMPGRGVDNNSRHFFNRAIDFVVYINDDLNFSGYGLSGLKAGTNEDTNRNFLIPEDILYVYLIKFINQNKNPFDKSGVGLLRNSKNRKTGYVHYEYMIDYREPKKELGYQKPLTKRTRRWVSKPKNKNEKSIYSAAFDQGDKDKIILDYVQKRLAKTFQTVPEKLLRLFK